MAHSFSFTSTTEDLLDAHAAHATLSGGVRPVLRIPLLFLGLLWVSVPLWNIVFRTADVGVGSVVMLLPDCAIVWRYLIRPILDRQRIKGDPIRRQDVQLEFGETGITVNTPPAPQFTRPWADMAGAFPCKKGLLIIFTSGVVNWLPKRVFSDGVSMAELQSFISEKTTKARA